MRWHWHIFWMRWHYIRALRFPPELGGWHHVDRYNHHRRCLNKLNPL